MSDDRRVGGTSDEALAAVVEKPRADEALAALRVEGVYDDSRSIAPVGDDALAVPVTAPPSTIEVRGVVDDAGLDRRQRGLDTLLAERGWSEAEIERAPGSWAVIGSVVLASFEDCPRPAAVGEALLDLHGEADTVLARGGVSGPRREPSVEVVAGAGDTETVHVEHGTTYAMDLAEVMFSPGNKAERARIGDVASPEEDVFDMFAGIGYFALPAARAGASVTAAEINPAAFRYLLENAVANGVEDRLRAYRADCRDVDAAADRVVMGHYDAHEYLDAAIDALRPGGVAHVHAACPEALLWDRPVERIERAAADRGREASVLDRRRVKGHSEGVAHVVVDARID